jgi:hypothetical protein
MALSLPSAEDVYSIAAAFLPPLKAAEANRGTPNAKIVADAIQLAEDFIAVATQHAADKEAAAVAVAGAKK